MLRCAHCKTLNSDSASNCKQCRRPLPQEAGGDDDTESSGGGFSNLFGGGSNTDSDGPTGGSDIGDIDLD